MGSSDYLRYPHLSGDSVTFVAENDVWVAPVSGGRAWRISAMQLPARNPRFSPDGKVIAWTVVQAGAPEVVAANADGGGYRRLTFWGHQNTRVKGFTEEGDVIATSAYRHEDPRLAWAYRVPLDGSAQTVLPYGPVDTIVHGEALGDERPVIIGSVMTREQAWWKRYRGGTAGKLWIDADGGGSFSRFVPELDGNLTDPMWVGGRVAFLSDHEGYGNLYSVDRQGSDLRRHTDNEDFYVRHASTDGERIVYESAGQLWLLGSLEPETAPERLDIELGSASTSRRPILLDAARHLAAAVPVPAGDASVVETHGTLHWLTHRDGPSRVIEGTAGVRARLGRPLGADGVVYVADHGGEESLYIRDVFGAARPAGTALQPGTAQVPERNSAGPALPAPVPAVQGAPAVQAPAGDDGGSGDPGSTALAAQDAPEARLLRTFAFDGPFRASELAVSPDGARVAVSGELGGLLVLEVASGTFFPLAAPEHGAINDVAFSGDSRWVTWAEPVTTEGARTRIRIARAEKGAEVHDLTDGRFRDSTPVFTRDGRYLAFLSDRSFDPVYDTHRFDLSFPASTKPFLVALAADTPSPFGPAAHSARPDGAGKDDGGAEDAPDAVSVDADRIGERIIAVPVAQGRYESLSAVEGALLWTAGEAGGLTGDGRATPSDQEPARRLERFDLQRRTVEVLVAEADSYRVSGDGSTAVVVRQGTVTAVPTSGKVEPESPERIEVGLERVRVLLDPVAVWKQAYQETWRLQRDFFWTPDLGGIDWEAVGAKYRPLLDRIGSHDDLIDVLWELHGELGTSHAYVTPALNAEPSGAQGFLGAELEPTEAGWTVKRIFAGESSDPQASSPLSAPGVAVAEGDTIDAVDGVPVPAGFGPPVLLTGSAGRTVELTVTRRDGDGAATTRRVAVVPLRSEERLRYQNWVNANRSIVHAASAGRFGYLHIPDMVANGWAQLHRDLDRETGRDALIVDVRRNRGGHTSQLVAELIGRKVTAWAFPRGEQPGTYPAHAPRGPVVILADEFAGSDGDIITQVAKLRGIGPVIGSRTWGGVVGIDGRFRLADGTGVTQPRYSFWMTGGPGWGVENYGVDPDIDVPFPPHAYAAGEDPQLEHGVATLKEMLTELPTDLPPAREGYRSLRPAPLPARPGS
ncbi:peptidase S41 [Arthrobacter crusticola]|uniref:Tricorn protease homolog n=1 Tax=Arthrobacter crusticola TaxID=2547960 RepID=A0A4V6PLN2_9MICC|nr:S41 family peptidase [Arthrobacter crusticola]TDK24156.1 peptidase S41 [Arthrobacter crusticola]